MFNISDDQAKTQINNFWSYLDELNEKNPEEYKKFISQQLKTGLQQSDPKKATVNVGGSTRVNYYICLRFKLSKVKTTSDVSVKVHERQSINEVPKILFSYEFQSQAFGKDIIEDPKVYLNIVYSDNYYLPVDEHNQQLKNPNDDNSWKYIPTQFRYNGKRTSMSNRQVEFYDVLVHSIIIEKIRNNEELKKSILAYISRKFAIYLENKYELFFKNVKLIKNYKSLKPIPEDFLIQPEDKKKVEDDRKPTPARNFYDIEENKIKIPNHSENFTNTDTFYNLPKETAKKPKGKATETKKILIEEIKQPKKITYKTSVLSNDSMEIKFDLSEFDDDLETIDIDLQVSKNSIKLLIENLEVSSDYIPVVLQFDKFTLCTDKIETAHFDKLNKVLKLILIKL
jgi:hypothetical protein